MIQNSYDGTPTLYVVPTPIGNLEDMTFRAINILKEVECIFSEDTRMTIKLLNYYEIKKKLYAMHKHNEYKVKEKVLHMLKEGYSVAIVSDRGTPLISDPGNIVVKDAILEGFNVVSLPGATAVIPALTSSEFDLSSFLFYGFLDTRKNKAIIELKKISDIKSTLVFYEAPHRLINTLNTMKEVFGDRKINISREISKKFEQIIRGTISEILDMNLDVKGEYVIVVEGCNDNQINIQDDIAQLSIKDEVDQLVETGLDKQSAFKIIASERNMKKSDVFKIYHKECE